MSAPLQRLDDVGGSPLGELLRPVVDSFRAELRAGARPAIEDRLKRAPAAARPELCRLLILEELRAKAEARAPLGTNDYLSRFGMLVDASWLELIARALRTDAPNASDAFASIAPDAFASIAWGVAEAPEFDASDSLDATGHFARSDEESVRNLEDAGPDEQPTQAMPSPVASSPDATSRVANSTSLPLPFVLGRYRLVSLLGKGGFGDVYLAEDPHLHRQVAIKTPRARHDGDPARDESSERNLEALLDEARNAAKLERIEGIVPVYDVGREGDVAYIVTQYVEGGSLADLLQRGRLPLAQALTLFANVCDVVERAHDAGWTHRDLKPSNILLGAGGRTFLTDFGLSVPFGERTSTEAQGTPRYMPPEIARATLDRLKGVEPATRREVVDGRADLYSLGVTFYQMLCGGFPFEAGRLREALERIVDSTPPAPHEVAPDVPEELSTLCMRLLEKDPARRPASAGEVADRIRAIATKLRLDESPERRRSRQRWSAATIGVVGVAILLAVVLFWSFGR